MEHIDKQERLGSAGDGRITWSHIFVTPDFTSERKCICDIKFVKWTVFKLVKQIQSLGDERIKKIVAAIVAEAINVSQHR